MKLIISSYSIAPTFGTIHQRHMMTTSLAPSASPIFSTAHIILYRLISLHANTSSMQIVSHDTFSQGVTTALYAGPLGTTSPKER
jgi:hypothetical protein